MTETLRARSSVRGRPSKEDARLLRVRIEQSALCEFRKRGYEGASIDGIARAAAVSRTTIYSLYHDKRSLFCALIKSGIDTTTLEARVLFDERPPEAVLHDAMIAINRAYHRGSNFAMMRLCMAEADRFPDLIAEVHHLFLQRLTGLPDYFERLQQRGLMTQVDGNMAVKLFNMLALGTLKPFFVPATEYDREAAEAHIDVALRVFLAGCLPGTVASEGT